MKSKKQSEEVTVPVLRFSQKGQHFYMGSLNAGSVQRMFQLAPNTRSNPDGVQRLLKTNKVNDIKDYCKKQDGYLPTTGIINIEKPVKIKKINGSPELYTITFKNVPKQPLEKGEEDKSFGYFIDHQHTQQGVVASGQLDYPLPWVFLDNAPRKIAWKLFADINSKQTPVNKVTLDRLKYKLWDLDVDLVDENIVVKTIDALNEDGDSVLQGKIRAYEDDKKTWVNLPALKKFLRKAFEEMDRLNLKKSENVTVLKNFYEALSNAYPHAWGDAARKDHVLCKSMGFYVTAHGIFPVAFRRVLANHGHGNWTVENFVKEIKGKIPSITIQTSEGSHTLKFDWKSSSFGHYSNEKGIQAIIKALKKRYKER